MLKMLLCGRCCYIEDVATLGLQNKLGRFNQTSHKKAVEVTIVVVAAALHRKPGLATAANALAQFRKDLTSGELNMAPRDCFTPENNTGYSSHEGKKEQHVR